MKIGLSLSRCMTEIIEGIVDYNDVLVIISRTNINPDIDDQWNIIWQGYRNISGLSRPEWIEYPDDDESKFRELAMRLYHDGKLHQPRQFGSQPQRRTEIWLETVLPNAELENNPAAKKAWDTFQTIAGLSGVTLDKEYR